MLNPNDFESKSLYEILQVPQTSSKQEIKKGYHKVCRLYHPDHNPSRRNECEAIFPIVQNAYEILMDDHERAYYDERLSQPQTKQDIKEVKGLIKKCMKNYSYESVNEAMDRIVKEEETGNKKKKEYVRFGDSNTSVKDVMEFYKFWEKFQTQLEFSYADDVDLKYAKNRKERKWAIEENLKCRKKEKKKYQSMVNKFVDFLKNKDKRYLEILQKKKERQEEKKKNKEKMKKIKRELYEKEKKKNSTFKRKRRRNKRRREKDAGK